MSSWIDFMCIKSFGSWMLKMAFLYLGSGYGEIASCLPFRCNGILKTFVHFARGGCMLLPIYFNNKH